MESWESSVAPQNRVAVVRGKIPTEAPAMNLRQRSPSALLGLLPVSLVHGRLGQNLPPTHPATIQMNDQIARQVVCGTQVSPGRLHVCILFRIGHPFRSICAELVGLGE